MFDTRDPFALLSQQHDALRGVLAWMPLAVDDGGRADPGDGRILRAVLESALVWHHADEEAVLLPRLVGLGQAIDDLSEGCRRHHLEIERAGEPVCQAVAGICRGESTDAHEWRAVCEDLRRALETAMQFEDHALLPTARSLLDADDREDMAATLLARADARPMLQELVTPPTLPRRVSSVTVLRGMRRAHGESVSVRRFADCPRGATVAVERCLDCPHALAVRDEGVWCKLEQGRAPLRVRDVMTRQVRGVTPEVALVDLVALLDEAGISGAPVVDPLGRAIGVVSQTDVVRTVAQTSTLAGASVADAMMNVAFCVDEDARVEDAAALLAYEGVHRLPVVNAERQVVGIVSALDLVRCRAVLPRQLSG